MPLVEQIKLALVECIYLNSVVWEDYQPVTLTALLAAEQTPAQFSHGRGTVSAIPEVPLRNL